MAVTVVEQLEMVDIDHHQRQRLALRSTARCHSRSICRSKARRLARPLRPSRLASSSRCSIGDLQFLFARGELGRHVVERGRERREFGDPRLLRRARMQIAAAETRRGAHQRPDRPHHELLAAEPGDAAERTVPNSARAADKRSRSRGRCRYARRFRRDRRPAALASTARGHKRRCGGRRRNRAPSSCLRRWRAFPASRHRSAKCLPIKACWSAEPATSVPPPSSSMTEAPECCAAVAARSPIHCRLITASTTPLTEPSFGDDAERWRPGSAPG